MRQGEPTENLPLILEEGSRSIAPQSRCASFSEVAGGTIYHGLDFLRIALVTQSLSSRWLFQLFVELERYGVAPLPAVQQSWLGWPIAGAAFLSALTVKIINARGGDKYRSAQDYLFAIFSSSVLYIILDFSSAAINTTSNLISERGNRENIGYILLSFFSSTSALIPLISLFMTQLVIPDSSDRITKQFDEQHFPAYPDATKKEKCLNITTGLSYSTAIAALFWTINREVQRQTSPMEHWQMPIAAAYALVSAGIGYHLTNHPKVTHAFIALSKAAKDGALSYAALSGIAFHILMELHRCVEPPCWDTAWHDVLAGTLTPLAISIGVFSGLTTLFHFEENHTANEKLIDRVINAPGRIKNKVTSFLSNCCCSLFGKNHAGHSDLEEINSSDDELSSIVEIDPSL